SIPQIFFQFLYCLTLSHYLRVFQKLAQPKVVALPIHHLHFGVRFTQHSHQSMLEPKTGFEPVTSSLPRMRSTPELLGPNAKDNGAGDETRTRDIQLGRLTLYQLSYSRSWCMG